MEKQHFSHISILVNIFTNVNSKDIYWCMLTKTGEAISMDYRKRIRDLREDHDKTQTEIAEALGTSQTMYARYERGASELPIRHLIRLAEYYNVTTDYLLGRTERPNG